VNQIHTKFEENFNHLTYFEKKKIQGTCESVLYWLNSNPEETIVLDQFKKLYSIQKQINNAIKNMKEKKEKEDNQLSVSLSESSEDESMEETNNDQPNTTTDHHEKSPSMELESMDKENLMNEVLKLREELSMTKKENFRLKTKINFLLTTQGTGRKKIKKNKKNS